MFKAIITRQNEHGKFDQVGMSNRTVVMVKDLAEGIREAEKFAGRGKGYRVEYFNVDRFYSAPIATREST